MTDITNATEVEAKPCPVCKRSGSAACSLCRGSNIVRGEYSLSAAFMFETTRRTARLLNCPGGCAAVVLCAGGTTSNELVPSLLELIEGFHAAPSTADAERAKERERLIEEVKSAGWENAILPLPSNARKLADAIQMIAAFDAANAKEQSNG